MTSLQIGRKRVGHGEPCFIIAEAGVNHNGDLMLAMRLIDVACEAGADAVKFQTFKVNKVLSRMAPKAKYQKDTTDSRESQYAMVSRLQLTDGDFRQLAVHARKRKITFLSTPFDEVSVDLLDELRVPAFKIASGEITNLSLLSYVAGKGKPMILSTGMSTLAEIREAVRAIRDAGNRDFILLHCVSAYPARVEDANLRVMATLEAEFRVPVGLSDHTLGIVVPIAAAALGAVVIEKHFTLSKSMEGPDHRASLDPAELTEMVKAIRQVEKSLGDGRKSLTDEERDTRKTARRSIVAGVDIGEGTTITENMLTTKRPGTGIPPKYLEAVVGSVAEVAIRYDEVVTWRKLRGKSGQRSISGKSQ